MMTCESLILACAKANEALWNVDHDKELQEKRKGNPEMNHVKVIIT